MRQVGSVEEFFDSRLELLVLEGGGKGQCHPLDRARVTLGRLDPGDEAAPGLVAFPDPTVSRVHAHLEWDPRKLRYVLEHRSRTNFTVLNGQQLVGQQVLEVGDRIKMGSLVVELQKCTHPAHRSEEREAEPVDSGLYLVALRGPAAGTILPLNYTYLGLGEGLAGEPGPGVSVPGAGETRGILSFRDQGFLLRPASTGKPLRVLRSRPGCVSETVASDPVGIPVDPECLLVCGAAVLAFAGVDRAGDLREAILGGAEPAELHPLLPSLDPSAEPCWQGTEEYLLRVMSGARRGSCLWLRPEELEGPATVGPAPADLEVPDKAARLAFAFRAGKVEVLNTDEALSFTHNWDLVTPGEEVLAQSGDRFTLGRSVVSFEHLPTQARIDALSLFLGDQELPLLRQVNSLGYNPESDLRLDDRRLAPTHGFVEVRPSGVVYRHKDPQSKASVGEVTVGAGQEVPLAPGEVLVLLPDLKVRLDARRLAGKPGDHVLIGPTQEELEAARAAREPGA